MELKIGHLCQKIKNEYAPKTFYIRLNALKTLLINQPFVTSMNDEEYHSFKRSLDNAFKLKGLIEINAIRERSQHDLQPLPGDTVRKVLEVAPDRIKVIIEFILMTGCHLRELVKIKIHDVQKVKGNKKIRAIRIPTKYNNEREVYILYNIINMITNIYQGDKYLFETRNGTPLDRAYVKRELKNVGRSAKFERKLSPTLLRDTFIEKMKRCHYNSEQISHYLGEPGVSLTKDERVGCEIVNCI